jgi:hypothetical protein
MLQSTDTHSAEHSLIFMEDDAAECAKEAFEKAAAHYPGHEATFIATVIQKLHHAIGQDGK